MKHPKRISDEKRAAIAEDYKAGMKVDEINKKHGIAMGTASYIAREAGLPTRKRTHIKKARYDGCDDNPNLRALYNERTEEAKLRTIYFVAHQSRRSRRAD